MGLRRTAPSMQMLPLRVLSRHAWLAGLGLVAILGGCTSLPPAKPVANLTTVAGKWEGELMTRNGPHPVSLVVNEDGSTVARVPSIPPGTFHGQYTAENGKIRSVSKTTGRTGTCTLHEGEGQRVLHCKADDGATATELRPAK